MIRRKIWDLNKKYLCSICGTCITSIQLKAILKDCGFAKLSKSSQYHIHTDVMNELSLESKLSKKVQQALDLKYKKEIRMVDEYISSESLYKIWQEKEKSSMHMGLYWAILTNPYLEDTHAQMIAEDMHMYIHRAPGELILERSEKSKLESRIRHLKSQVQKFKSLKIEYSEMKNNMRINSQIKGSISEEKETNLQNYMNNEKMLIQLKDELNIELQIKIDNQRLIKDLNKENDILKKQLKDHLEDLHTCPRISKEISSKEPQEEFKDLENKKILLVGGRKTLKEYCQRLINSSGGVFNHHDGGKEQSKKALCSYACQADLVICALDCISHNACKNMKKICKEKHKKIIYLKNSGINNLSNELNSINF